MLQARGHLRTAASALVRTHRWLPAATSLASGLALILGLAFHQSLPVVVGAALALLLATYVWGYSAHAFRQTIWPSLDRLHRRQYAEVWDALAPTLKQAAEAACGVQEEDKLRRSDTKSARELLELISIGPEDDVLELGCGVGRVGWALASHCRHWTGADISTNMLNYAAPRLRGVSNIRLVQPQSAGLEKFSDNSFTVVYTTDLLEHRTRLIAGCACKRPFVCCGPEAASTWIALIWSRRRVGRVSWLT